MSSSAEDVPRRLRSEGKKKIPIFGAAEKLFRRIEREDLADDGEGVLITAFDEGWPKLSVNRSGHDLKLSYPADVQYPKKDYGHCGALEANYADVPVGCRPPGVSAIHLSVVHTPLPMNYAHAEIVSTTETGELVADSEGKDIPPYKMKAIKNQAFTALRMQLAEVFTLALMPGVTPSSE